MTALPMSCMYDRIICMNRIVTYRNHVKKINHGNDIWPENICSLCMHPVGFGNQKPAPQPAYSMRPCVEVREGYFKDRAVQPSATIMSWVNRTHYALSGTTCRDFVESLLGATYREYWRVYGSDVPPHAPGRDVQENSPAIFRAIRILFWKPSWTHADAFSSQADVHTINRNKMLS